MLARQAGLSPFYFHRLFTNWAGVTPKDFLQCLTLAQVKESLRNGASVLESALDAGLSGPGRLHDLCVNLEAASPGEMKAGGAHWTMAPALRRVRLEPVWPPKVRAEFVICLLWKAATKTRLGPGWTEEWPNARLRRNDSTVARIAGQILRPFR